MGPTTRIAVCGVIAIFGQACGGSRQPAQFRGYAEAQIARPAEIREEAVLPEGYERVGELTSSCTQPDPREGLERAYLSDVDCSEWRLSWALRARAAEVGGELLVGRRCAALSPERDGERELRCTAEVARPSQTLLSRRSPRSPAAAPVEPPGVDAETARRLDDPTGTEAFNIRVSYYPVPAAPQRAPRPATLVSEFAVMPLSHVTLGAIVAHCEHPCSEGALRAAVRVTAGRVGGDAVDIRCIDRNSSRSCSGTAATYERELALEPVH